MKDGSENEICGGCLLKSVCKAPEASECISPQLRRKAVWLMFIIPLIIITVFLFLLVGMMHWNELLSFGVVILILTVYYIIIRKISSINDKQ